MSTVIFSTNSLNKASGLLLLLVRISTGHAHFLYDEVHEPMRPTTVFSVVVHLKSALGKLPIKSIERRYIHPVFKLGKETIFEPSKHSNPYACIFSTGDLEQATAYPEVYPNIKIMCLLQLCYTFIPIGWENLINCFSSLPASLFTPPPLISLLLLSITCTHILMLRRLAIISQHSKCHLHLRNGGKT